MGKIASCTVLAVAVLLLTACQKGPPWKPPAPIVESAPSAGTVNSAG